MFQQHDFCTNSGYQGLMVAISTGPALNIGQLRRRTTFAIQTQGSIDRYGHAGVFQLLQGHNGLPTLVSRAQYTRRGAGSPEPTHR